MSEVRGSLIEFPDPVFEDEFVTLYCADSITLLPFIGGIAATVTDPPYGETSLAWDKRVDGWLDLLPGRSLWCFGSLKSFVATGAAFSDAGWQHSQEIVWEKHNGSNFHADRFRRVHELAAHFYKGEWSTIYRDVPKTMDARKHTMRRKAGPTHTGDIGAATYTSEDGGPRLMRSVVYCRSSHGSAVHPTQKPEGILRPLIEYAVPVGGIVLDPFAGSGSTGIAARQIGRKAVLIEKNPEYAEAAANRLAQVELGVAL